VLCIAAVAPWPQALFPSLHKYDLITPASEGKRTMASKETAWEGLPCAALSKNATGPAGGNGHCVDPTLSQDCLLWQRMAGASCMAGHVPHYLNNLLTIVTLYAELIGETVGKDESALDYVGKITGAAKRAQDMCGELLQVSMHQAMPPAVDVPLASSIDVAAGAVRAKLDSSIELVVEQGAPDCSVGIALEQIVALLCRLAANASTAMSTGGTLSITTELADPSPEILRLRDATESDADTHVCITVSDTGHGMESAVARRAFEPFFSTKDKQGDRTPGLGLSVAYGIVASNGGTMRMNSEPGHGTTVRIWLPAALSPEGATGQGPGPVVSG